MKTQALHELIRRARVARKMRQADLGKMFGVSQQAIWRWENGELPGEAHTEQLAEFLDVEPEMIERIRADRVTSSQIDMSDELRDVLLFHRSNQREADVRNGIRSSLVFHSSGKLLSQNTIRRIWERALTKAGIGHRRLHDIRHTFASLLLSRGAPLPYVSAMLGHSSQQITLTRYSHYMPTENEGYVRLLTNEEKLGRGCKNVAEKLQPSMIFEKKS